jgi:DNA helicase II / ATP-dependent DNA helicase PcrA
MNWSTYQQAIFSAVTDSDASLMVNAVAGSGKTTVLEECGRLLWEQRRPQEPQEPQEQGGRMRKVVFVAFSKDIATEINRRFKAKGLPEIGSTLHSVGWAAWRLSLGLDGVCEVDNGKVFAIMKEVIPNWKEREKWGETTRRMVGLGKQVGIVPDPLDRGLYPTMQDSLHALELQGLVEDTEREWERLADHYGVDWKEVHLGLVRRVLARSIEMSRETCDFDDMLYMPVVAGVKFPRYDVVFVDEAQDVSGIQIEMVSRMACGTGRVIAVGDRNQAIYGFRGAHTSAMDDIRDRFSCQELPLSISYRCPVAVVQHAQQWVPEIEAREDAPWGYVAADADWAKEAESATGRDGDTEDAVSKWQGINDFAAGDAILCRCSRPLVEVAFGLVRKRIPCRVLGREIGSGLVAVIKSAIKQGSGDVRTSVDAFGGSGGMLEAYVAGKCARWAEKQKFAEIASLRDKADTIRVFLDEAEGESHARAHGSSVSGGLAMAASAIATVGDLIAEIERVLTSENGAGVTLATVHKAKGLEFARVFVLDAEELMPGPWARSGWEMQQEQNLRYVAATRAKRELRYVRSKELLGEGEEWSDEREVG